MARSTTPEILKLWTIPVRQIEPDDIEVILKVYRNSVNLQNYLNG